MPNPIEYDGRSEGLKQLLAWENSADRVLYGFWDTQATKPKWQFNNQPGPDLGRDLPPNNAAWKIEAQWYGLPLAIAGLYHQKPQQCELGIAAFDYGLRQMQPDGRFISDDEHHSTSFFLEAAARIALLKDTLPVPELETWIQKLPVAVARFADRRAWNDNWWRDSLHHRFFLNASVIFLTRSVTPKCSTLQMDQAYSWANEGLRRLLPNGASTELGGYDTGYHSLALTFATGSVMAGTMHHVFREQMLDGIRSMTHWLCSRIDEEGTIDDKDNTRMHPHAAEKDDRSPDNHRRIKFFETAFALRGAAMVLNDPNVDVVAQKVMKRYLPVSDS